MGMFDDLICKYPLPVEGANALSYQTKDTPRQFMDLYEIREDGTLWHEEYDTEDRSDAALWALDNPGKTKDDAPKELDRFCGCIARCNKRWEFEKFTGEIRFYTSLKETEPNGWIEWSAYFLNGKLDRLNLIEHRTA